jgi:hypothetical protein
MLTPFMVLRNRVLEALKPVIITSAKVQGDSIIINTVLEGAEDYVISATVDSNPVTLIEVNFRERSFEYTATNVDQLLEWTVTASNDAGETSVSGEFTISASIFAPSLSDTSAVISGRTLTVSVTPSGNPTPSLSVVFTVDSESETMVNVSPGVWTYTFDPSASAITYNGTVTGTNGTSPDATYNFSGTLAATLSVPSAFTNADWFLSNVVTVPSSFQPDDWSLNFVQPVATAPDLFGPNDWSVSSPPPVVLPPPSGTLSQPRSVVATKRNDQSATITWLAPLTGTVSRYDVEWAYVGSSSWTPSVGVSSPFTLGGLPRGGQQYQIRVVARDASGGSTVSSVATFTTDWRPYGIEADWNRPISSILSRGTHPNETYFRDVLWFGNEGPGNTPNPQNGVNWCNFFSRDYTYPVYRSSDAGGQTAQVSVSAGNWRNGVVPWNPAWTIPAGTDAQVIILDESTGVEFNGWNLRYVGSPPRLVSRDGNTARLSRITADQNDPVGGVAGDYRTKTNGFRPSRGVGIQYLAMLITPQEIEQGKIYHALSMVMRRSGYRYFCTPATKGERFSGNEADYGVPQGTRFYLDISDAEINAHVASWPSGVPQSTRNTMRIVFKAMQEYGWIATDQGGDNHIQFQHDASTDWTPYGLDEIFVNGKNYPRDAIDGLLSDRSRIKCLRPPDNILHRYELGGDNPPRTPNPALGIFQFRNTSGPTQVTTVGIPAISGNAAAGSVLTVSRPAQFIGENPVTVEWVWQYNGVDVPGTLNQTNYTKPGGSAARTRWYARNNRGTSVNQFSNSI